jgi:hypothetical protein
MVIDRRSLLLGAAAGALAGMPARADVATPALYAAARKGADGGYSVAIFTADGRDVRALALPGRGHDVTVSPVDRTCVAFARRPGNFAIAFSADNHRPPIAFTTPPDRHFYGHGVFSHDGRLLYTTENDFDGARGVIGIYDVAAGYRRIGEFSSGGIGPHDLALLEGGRVLVVANGGLREHPDIGGGRRILNPDAIETTLAYIDLRTGALLERHDLGAAGTLSLRHLDVARDGTVIVGAQIVHGPTGAQSLVYRHRRQQRHTVFALPAEVADGLSGYVSSIACDRAGDFVAVTSSRGALAVVIDIASGRLMRTRRLEDVSGVAPAPTGGGFLTTSGLGRVTVIPDGAGVDHAVSTPWAWDNHAVLVAGDPRSALVPRR